MAANLQQQRTLNEQLRREACIPRIQVSEACNAMMKYMLDNETDDCLLSGFTSQKVNPFREKNSCSIL
ncbi:guanine nucleotide-binding protein subunit gamma-1 [Drosophila sulfurigaster albostrigata]|uniref:Guanine nucleotide-binding protein subunit gamma-1 n=1 Tax=Drosophila albomicans TaxID=7291 RepID=A0A6P8WY04_DROAB|nr:guanine nucleotide-binding protein subunit gamma-1 [Drosophila albomicans]XP_062134139.1 guanine nucleotide-binding protein subunit gamma-1 [Drosophila sulfurigaster albostrigata]